MKFSKGSLENKTFAKTKIFMINQTNTRLTVTLVPVSSFFGCSMTGLPSADTPISMTGLPSADTPISVD